MCLAGCCRDAQPVCFAVCCNQRCFTSAAGCCELYRAVDNDAAPEPNLQIGGGMLKSRDCLSYVLPVAQQASSLCATKCKPCIAAVCYSRPVPSNSTGPHSVTETVTDRQHYTCPAAGWAVIGRKLNGHRSGGTCCKLNSQACLFNLPAQTWQQRSCVYCFWLSSTAWRYSSYRFSCSSSWRLGTTAVRLLQVHLQGLQGWMVWVPLIWLWMHISTQV